MRKPSVYVLFSVGVAAVLLAIFTGKKAPVQPGVNGFAGDDSEEAAATDQRARFIRERAQYEFDMLKDPHTGRIPAGVQERALQQALAIPLKQYERDIIAAPFSPFSPQGPQINNTYIAAGPNNQGGRTRAMAFDRRYNGSSNRVILAGSVSGGIFRTTDGGISWNRVTPEGQVHNVTAIAQDPTAPDTWYAGGGEALGNSAAASGAYYYGFGILKSTDNGQSWTQLTRTITDINGSTIGPGVLEGFDNPFDIVHKIVVSPANGNLYICGHRRLIRSTDGGASFRVVFGGTTATTAAAGQMDIASNPSGRLYLAVNGGFPDIASRGIWTSLTGDAGSWIRFAGGQTLGTDSLPNWRGNAYHVDSASNTYSSRRILIALAPSDPNTLYAFYENGLSQAAAKGAKPEADLFRFDLGAGTATNLSANMPDFPGQYDGVDPLAVQGGYDMMLAVKPDNPNIVFIGGTNLYRSTDGFSSTANTEWIGGYAKNTSAVTFNLPTHPDIHSLVFDPTNASRAICANDGGIQVTDNIMAANMPPGIVNWTNLNNYQTLQYYHVAIDPAAGQNNFLGGAQDNGTYFRDSRSPTPDNHSRVFGGDGGAVGISNVSNSSFTLFFSVQQGDIYRDITNGYTKIRPANSEMTAGKEGGYGEFVTNFIMDADNPEDLYYVNFNKLFRTTGASTVTTNGWTYLQGVAAAVNPAQPNGTDVSIRALALSRGTYFAGHALYFGTTNGKLFRLDNPRNALPAATPVEITPPGMSGTVSGISVNPNNDAELLVTVSNYNTISIYWTKTAKNTAPVWKNAEGNLALPSARSCMIVVKKDGLGNPLQEYYVGTSVGLYSAVNIGDSLTGGSSLTWVREGGSLLNFAVISGLGYRPQDNALLVGTHGNGMYFTNTGTPDFRPGQDTGSGGAPGGDPVFIRNAYPNPARDYIFFGAGTTLTVKRIVVQLHTVSGQLVLHREMPYQDAILDISGLPKGHYTLTIRSADNQQRFVRRVLKL